MALWGNTDEDTSKPKYVKESTLRSGEVIIFVDDNEAKVPANIARGINNAGWWQYYTWEDANGNTRHQAECLIAFGSAVASVTGDNDEDDTVALDTDIVITTQPESQSVASPAGAEFTVVAENFADVVQTYEWFVDDVAVVASAVYSGEDSDTLVIADSTGLDGKVYKVVISAAGATSVTSDEVTLTVTA